MTATPSLNEALGQQRVVSNADGVTVTLYELP